MVSISSKTFVHPACPFWGGEYGKSPAAHSRRTKPKLQMSLLYPWRGPAILSGHRHIIIGANEGTRGSRRALEYHAHTKISNLDITSMIYQQILRLQVAVDDMFFMMKIPQPLKYLILTIKKCENNGMKSQQVSKHMTT